MNKLNTANELVVDENALVELFLQGTRPNMVTMQSTAVIDRYNRFCNLFLFDGNIDVELSDSTTDKYMATLIDNWWLPIEYKEISVYDYLSNCLEKHLNCNADGDRMYSTAEWKRVCEEMDVYVDRGLTPVLKFMIYLVDTMRANNIVWGVGRGSSVASYVLFLIGVHKIDSMKYNLDYKEFLR
jgi:DNA polymerase III alpha subunit